MNYHYLCFCVYQFLYSEMASTEIYTLSLHDALPICRCWMPSSSPHRECREPSAMMNRAVAFAFALLFVQCGHRSEEHTSELQSREKLVCRLLLAKKKETHKQISKELNTLKVQIKHII